MLFKEFTVLLNPQSKKIVIGICLNAIGGGMTLSLLLVYLHDLRGFTNTFGGLLLGYASLVSIAASGPLGSLVDRFGPRKVLIPGLIAASAGALSLSVVDTHVKAIAAMTVINIAMQAIWPTQTVILTRLTPEAARQKIFAFNFILLNLGLGLGGFLSALIIQAGDLRSFQIMYWIDGGTFLAYLVIVLTIKDSSLLRPATKDGESAQGSYREIFQNRPLVLLGIAGIILFTFSYGTLQAGLQIFTTQYLGLSPKWLGIILGVNTLAIVLFQSFVLRFLERYSKYSALIAISLIWAFSWLFFGIAPLLGLFASGIAICISQLIFAFGEMVQAPTIPTLANELSAENTRGRANALMSLQWGISGALGPAITGVMFGAHLEMLWVATMFTGCFLSIPIFLKMKSLALAKQG